MRFLATGLTFAAVGLIVFTLSTTALGGKRRFGNLQGISNCQGTLEINTLRAGSATIRVNESTGFATRDVTAKARITKGSAPDGTLCPGSITLTNDETAQVEVILVTFEVGKGGQGEKRTFTVPDSACGDGDITFTAEATAVGASSTSAVLPKSVICR